MRLGRCMASRSNRDVRRKKQQQYNDNKQYLDSFKKVSNVSLKLFFILKDHVLLYFLKISGCEHVPAKFLVFFRKTLFKLNHIKHTSN